MTDEKKQTIGGAAQLQKFFGKKDGQTLADFAAELKQLTQLDKQQIGQGIADGKLTY